MSYDLSKYLVIGISSRALFDLSIENEIFERDGLDAYARYQREHEDEILKPGPGFPLVRALLKLNRQPGGERRIEIVIMSRNSTSTSVRLANSIKHYELDVPRWVLSGGRPLAPYLKSYSVSLFLSLDEKDVQTAINTGIAAAHLYRQPEQPLEELDEIRIAFDGDAVLFSDHSEKIFQEKGIEAFAQHEKENALQPLSDGPFANLLRALSFIQRQCREAPVLIRTALVTARGAPAHERVIHTLRAWNVDVDESFFLGGASKTPVLEAFKPHMFFDDQSGHCEPASKVVPTGKVPYRAG